MKSKIFSLPFGKMDYALFTTKKQYKKFCEKLNLPVSEIPDGANALSVWHSGDHGDLTAILMFNLKNIPRDQLLGLLVHEGLHVWQFFLENIREESPSNEIEAYSIQEIFQNLMAEYDRQTA